MTLNLICDWILPNVMKLLFNFSLKYFPRGYCFVGTVIMNFDKFVVAKDCISGFDEGTL